jgi:hypothetical protein
MDSIVVAIISGLSNIFTALIGRPRKAPNISQTLPDVDDNESSNIIYPDITLISAGRTNAAEIQSDFVLWPECSIMLWMFVPPDNQPNSLRDKCNNRYLISHYTGIANNENQLYFNQFSFRYSERGTWDIQSSNDKGIYSSKYLSIKDNIEPGWHHFLIAWNGEKLIMSIDRDKTKRGEVPMNDVSSCWPRNHSKTCLGAWTRDQEIEYYCETKIFRICLVKRYLNVADKLIEKHYAIKPL